MIEENGKNISGGEAQRIAFARCLAAGKSFLIFDELLSALDNKNASELEEKILSLQDIGVLMVTHRIFPENMKKYDQILVMEAGEIVERGSYFELMERKGEFYRQVTACKNS